MSLKSTVQFLQSGDTSIGKCGATTLVGKEGYCVKLHTDGTLIVNSSQGEYCWPLITAGAVGAPVAYATPGAVVYLYAGATFSIGDYLTSDGSGGWMTAASADYVGAIALEAATAAGDFVKAVVLSPRIVA